MVPTQVDVTRKRSILVLLGAAFSLGIGGLALILAVVGLLGRGGAADRMSALPNLITGIASIAGAVGYLTFKKWAIPTYTVAVIGHIVSHVQLVMAHGGPEHIASRSWLPVLLPPVIALLVLIDMIWEKSQEKSV